MKHEDVPGYTELRTQLFQVRFKLQTLKSEKERAKVHEELRNIKREMAKVLLEDAEKKKGK